MSVARLPEVPTGQGTFRLVGCRLIDGVATQVLDDAEIVVTDHAIAYAGPRRTTGSDGIDTVDLGGATVLPGFIDCHVHLGLDLEIDPGYRQRRHTSERVLDAARTIEKTLQAGITTARDLGGLDAGYREAIRAGTIVGPRLHLALVPLSPTGGHTDFHLTNGTNVNPGFDFIDPVVDSDDDVRRTVRLLVRSGADVIKVCSTGGVSSPTDTPNDIGITEHQVRIIVEEMAKRHGQPVASHAQGREGIRQALAGGVASVEHGYEIDADGIDQLLESGAFLVPTLSSALRVPDPSAVPDYLYEKKRVWSSIAREHLTQALQAGVRVAMGTDSGVCPHGRNLTELGFMVELGMSPMDAIKAGTTAAAALLRLDDHLGSIEKGKLADLVITPVDPLSDIHALGDPDSIRVIIQGGRVVKDLDATFPDRQQPSRLTSAPAHQQ